MLLPSIGFFLVISYKLSGFWYVHLLVISLITKFTFGRVIGIRPKALGFLKNKFQLSIGTTTDKKNHFLTEHWQLPTDHYKKGAYRLWYAPKMVMATLGFTYFHNQTRLKIMQNPSRYAEINPRDRFWQPKINNIRFCPIKSFFSECKTTLMNSWITSINSFLGSSFIRQHNYSDYTISQNAI